MLICNSLITHLVLLNRAVPGQHLLTWLEVEFENLFPLECTSYYVKIVASLHGVQVFITVPETFNDKTCHFHFIFSLENITPCWGFFK